jgi:hypothetical protein
MNIPIRLKNSTDVINIILNFDGRIKFKKGNYVNIIHKYDVRYSIVQPFLIHSKNTNTQIGINGSITKFEFSYNKNNKIIQLVIMIYVPTLNETYMYDVKNKWHKI